MADKKEFRKKHLDEFKINEKGEYSFAGGYYIWPEGTRRASLVRMWILGGSPFLLCLIQGSLPDPGVNGMWYVLLPYCGTAAASFLLLWALGRLTSAGEKIRDYVYKGTAEKIPRRAAAAAVLAGITAAGRLAGLFAGGTETGIALPLAFVLCSVMETVLCILLRKFMTGLSFSSGREKESSGGEQKPQSI